MPTYRSVSISLISHYDTLPIPEFNPSEVGNSDSSNATVNAASPDRIILDDPENRVVSVYVPASPGSQFWISYSIVPPYPSKGLFYFKLFLNGVHVVSWGASEEENWTGRTMYGFFNSTYEYAFPESKYLERGAFRFGVPVSETHFAQDVLEIRVFRSKGRKRRERIVQDAEDVMDRVRKQRGNDGSSQDQQGISLANAGIVEVAHPQRFYDFALIDPLDQPYATFRFHPRSPEKLVALGLLSPRQDHEDACSIETTQSSSPANRPSREQESETSVRVPVERATRAWWTPAHTALQTNLEAALTSSTPHSASNMSGPVTAMTTPSPSPDFRDPSLSERYSTVYNRQRWTPSLNRSDGDPSETETIPARTSPRADGRPTAGSLRDLVASALRRRGVDTQRPEAETSPRP
ncbi:MAG: hypothetical protein M1816_004434 [Peltula sp. TS41687]|nr:MAG: hypothetical protein M1816_004434 [Peltula sp. TS41687]